MLDTTKFNHRALTLMGDQENSFIFVTELDNNFKLYGENDIHRVGSTIVVFFRDKPNVNEKIDNTRKLAEELNLRVTETIYE